MKFKNIACGLNILEPATTSIETNAKTQPDLAVAEALLHPNRRLYRKYLLWQAQKAIEELETAEWQSLPPKFNW